MNTLDLTLLDALVARAAEPVAAVDVAGLASRLRRADGAVRIRQAACVGVGIAAGALVVVAQGGDSATRIDTQVPAARPYTGSDPGLPVVAAAPAPTTPALDSQSAAPAEAPAPAEASPDVAANDAPPHSSGPAVPPGEAPEVPHDPPPTETPPTDSRFSASQRWGSCDEDPPYEEFKGTAAPGATVTATSPFGGGSTTAGTDARWYLRVEFPEAPVNVPFLVTVTSGANAATFTFTRTG